MTKYEFNPEIPRFIYKALYNDCKYSIIVAGRRSGKTYNAVQWLCEMLLYNPNKSAIWVDTTQNNLDNYIDLYFKKILQNFGNAINYNKQSKTIIFPNNSYIHLKSAERPENIEGLQYNYGVLNEAGIIFKRPALWNITLLPMFKGDNTRVKIIGTPKGKNLFHELYVRGNSGDKLYKSFHFSSYDSPFYDNNELDQLKSQMPYDAYRQNILAEFLDGAGSVFRNIQKCIKDPKYNLIADIMSVDLAKHKDFTVITLLNREHKQVVEIDRFNQIDWNFQKNRIVNIWRKYNQPKVIVDSTGAGDPIYDDLRSIGMNIEGFKFTNQTKKDLIQSLSLSIDNQEIFFPNNKELISELEVFGYDITPMGNIRYNAPEGLHDDMVISLAMANWLIKQTKPFTFISNY